MTLQDIRHSVRLMRRAPMFTAVVVLTLALGIGANTAIFSAAYAVLVRPLPYTAPEQLFAVETTIPERGFKIATDIRDVVEWRGARTVFTDVTSTSPTEWTLTGVDEPERVGGALVAANFFSVLGVRMAAGRTFVLEDEQPGHNAVAIVSDGLWRRHFGSDPALVGKRIELNGTPHTVVGIAPRSLLVPTGVVLGLDFAPRIDVWTPIVPKNLEALGYNYSHVVLARLGPNGTLAQGRQQLETMLNAPGKLPPGFKPWQVAFIPVRAIYAGPLQLRLLLVLGAAAVLLLIACANLTNLFLGRVASRSTEIATRVALGATRTAVVVQVLTEVMLTWVLGGLTGLLVAYAGIRLLLAYGSTQLGPLVEGRLSAEAVVFAVLTTMLAGAVAAWVPATRATGADIQEVLIKGTRTVSGTGPNRALVGAQMALATVLLTSAALLLHSFVNALGANRGYDVERILTVDLAVSGPRYATPLQRTAFYRELTSRVGHLPGVTVAGAISQIPATGNDSNSQTVFLGSDTDSQSVMMQRPVAGIRSVTPQYAVASGSVIRAGRFFTEQDPLATAVVSESLARRLWPGEPLTSIPGRTIRQGATNPQLPPVTVIGVLADVRPGAVERELKPQLYRPHLLNRADGRMSVIARTTQDPSAVIEGIRAEIRRMDANLPIPTMRTVREIVSDSMAQRRFQAALTLLFAIVALCLGAGGVYGVVNYSVVARMRDIGLRIALGATNRQIRAWVLSIVLQPVGVGVVLGLLAAAAVGMSFQTLLFGVAPIDVPSIIAVVAILLSTSLLACYVPARRATRLDPITALRHD